MYYSFFLKKKKKKRNPVPIKMRKGILLKEITNALNSTYYFINSGGCR